MTQKAPLSPQIHELEQELLRGNLGALALFWEKISKTGTPLVESIEGDNLHRLVTFIWRSNDDLLKTVVVLSYLGGADFANNQMTRLQGADVWHKTYVVRKDLRITYTLAPNDSLVALDEEQDINKRKQNWRLDPLNHKQFIIPKDDEVPGDQEFAASVCELPDAPVQPWIVKRPNISKGKIEMHRFKSGFLGNERRIWIYTPPGYTYAREPYDLLVAFEGKMYLDVIPISDILDNLLADGLIFPTVAVICDTVSAEARNQELHCYSPFADFLACELVPWLRDHYHVTVDPARVMIVGSSAGGLAASFTGLFYPEVFGNVLSQSGIFGWKPDHVAEYGWLIKQFEAKPKVPLRFYLEVGLFETEPWKGGGPGQLIANRQMREVLQSKGYSVYYSEYYGGHAYVAWRSSIADGILALFGQIDKFQQWWKRSL